MEIWYNITVISGLSCLVPAVAGWWRLQKIRPVFYPFIVVLTANYCAELLSFILVKTGRDNTGWYNCYALIYLLLILLQLYKWSPARSVSVMLRFSGLLLCLLWLFTCLFAGGLAANFTLFLLFRDSSIAAFCFLLLYQRIPACTFSIYKDAVVLICCGWLFLFVYDGIMQLLFLWGQWLENPSLPYLQPFYSIVNFLVLLIHLIAVIWIPPKTPL
ncbi:hypothetical protein SAMN04487894_10432 [Niabella drilacis]|uniref:YhhN-like protein n=1 Tax=Niabella drilacis (strain DSM 25811 / CCM 8410 / CCUG 62505 / LMG 26954 / E90) TaxID=1285928 RepID=A0A1G6PGN4_NIADE|nr:hypothetical protein SAMN04487894_10432 [Niabella drilacis]